MLKVKDLHTYFYTDQGESRAVEGASFDIPEAQTLALVGESGCGKTVTALSILRLINLSGAVIVKGQVIFRGEDLLNISESKMRSVRGLHIGMIFQEPMSSLNPLYAVGYQITETLLAHQAMKKSQAKKQALQLLKKVEVPFSEQRYDSFPHQLSGGLRQRAMIAQGIACGPSLLIADEPTTALDVTIQAQILQLFSRLKETTRMSILLITHDLGIVSEIADRVCVMYAGRIVEDTDVLTIFNQPKHPYTQGLLRSIGASHKPGERFAPIPGVVPRPENKPSGCPFHPRCNKADKRCSNQMPLFLEIARGHKVACWKAK